MENDQKRTSSQTDAYPKTKRSELGQQSGSDALGCGLLMWTAAIGMLFIAIASDNANENSQTDQTPTITPFARPTETPISLGKTISLNELPK